MEEKKIYVIDNYHNGMIEQIAYASFNDACRAVLQNYFSNNTLRGETVDEVKDIIQTDMLNLFTNGSIEDFAYIYTLTLKE